jgi:hypothetical protein
MIIIIMIRSGLTHPEVPLMVSPDFFCLLICSLLLSSVCSCIFVDHVFYRGQNICNKIQKTTSEFCVLHYEVHPAQSCYVMILLAVVMH